MKVRTGKEVLPLVVLNHLVGLKKIHRLHMALNIWYHHHNDRWKMSLGHVKITSFVSISFCGNAELGLVRFRLKKRLVRLRKREFFGFIYLVLNTMNTAEKCPKVKFKRNTIFPFKFLFCKRLSLAWLGTKRRLAGVRKRKWFGLKYPVSSPQRRLRKSC